MSDDDRWVVISALVVAGCYAYRRLIETPAENPTLKNIVGIGNPAAFGAFFTAWGFTFLVVSMISAADTGLGNAFALLIMTADLLTNAQPIASDVTAPKRGQALRGVRRRVRAQARGSALPLPGVQAEGVAPAEPARAIAVLGVREITLRPPITHKMTATAGVTVTGGGVVVTVTPTSD